MNPLANQNDFVDLTYDINVVLDSIQVTYDGDNMETVEGVKNAWSEINTDSTTATMSTSDAKEIASVSWTFKN